MSDKQRYPLSWPAGWKRSTMHASARFGTVSERDSAAGIAAVKNRVSIGTAFDRLENELHRFGVSLDTVIVSTNLKLNFRGMPIGSSGEPADPGVAVYWSRKGKAECMAIDTYRRVADNLAAVAASLNAMRAIERHGGAQILERAFFGFAQLPEAAGARHPWREILGFADIDPSPETLEHRYRQLATQLHPDKVGGDGDRMVQLNLAYADARREIGG